MNEALTQLGVGGIFTIMVLQMVFSFLKSKSPPKDPHGISKRLGLMTDAIAASFQCIERKLDELLVLTKDLHTWHNVSDNEGVKIWYVRRSLEDAIGSLSSNIAKQTDVLQAMMREIHDLERDVLQK